MANENEIWAQASACIGEGRLSVVLPVYNLGASIAENLRKIAALYTSHGLRAELIPVDDGSTDSTRAAIESVAREYADATAPVLIKPVFLETNSGKGAALRAGFEASVGKYVLLLDGDLDINPTQTARFFAELRAKKADIVVGSKRHPESVVQYPWHRRLVSWVYFTLVRCTIGLPITDTQTGMKLFKRDILGAALGRMLVKTYAFDLELLAIAYQRGARIVEAPVVINFGSKFGALKPSTVRAMSIDSLAVFYRLRVLNYYASRTVPAPLAHPPLVSVIIACPRASSVLEECLDGLARQTYTNFEVLVLPDEAESTLEGHPNWRVILTGKVRPAEKRNKGLAAAKGEIVAFIDDDAYPECHWLEYGIREFGDPTVGAVGGPGVTPPNDSFLAKLGGRVYDNPLISGNYRYRYRAGGICRDVDDYPSCNLFVRKNLLDTIKGYRTDFWPGEDTLLCKDILETGARIFYSPWVIVYHHRRALFAAHLRQLGRYAFHRGYFVKRYSSNSRHFSYFIPSFFVLYLILLALSAAFLPCAALCAASVPLALYAALAAVTTFSLNPLVWLLTFVGVVVTHLTYGVRFVQGLLARKAPCEFIGKDHA